MPKPLLIVNPVAGGGRGRRTWEQVSAEVHAQVECAMTERVGHGAELASEAVREGRPRVIALGGDGTVNEVASALAGTDVALGVVPAGTGNDFATQLGVPAEPVAAVRLALEGSISSVDIGEFRTRQRHGFFANVAGFGFDAAVAQHIHTATYRGPFSGTLPYVMGVLTMLWSFRPCALEIEMDGRAMRRTALLAAVANGPCYGGGMRIAPDAVCDDGLFDVCLVGDLSRFDVLKTLPRMYSGGHRTHPKVEFFRCRELRATVVGSREIACQADGELVGGLPASFSMHARGLRCVTGRRA
jgi:YegS/Rv2252/BmrU family lipid kinase